MGNEYFNHRCKVETKRIIWLIGLIFASVLIIQHFELPYRDQSMLSLLFSGKSHFDNNNRNNSTSVTESENAIDESSSYELSNEDEVGLISSISPSSSLSFGENGSISISIPPENSRIGGGPTSPDISPGPAISPSQSVSPIINKQINDEKSKESDVIVSPLTKEIPSVLSVSEMKDTLIRSRVSSFSKSPHWPSKADQELLEARIQIANAPIIGNHPILHAPIYRNLSSFVRSYQIMEEMLKIYIYKDGKKPVFHKPRLKGIYASEGWFMKLLEESKQFVTNDPLQAHLFYLPFSSQLLVDYVYVPDSHSFHEINVYLKNYLDAIKGRYLFWNRTDGMDHFLVACHDWAPIETRKLMANCIRALCNSDIKEGFRLGNDVSLPETKVPSPQKPLAKIGGAPPSDRKILAFFAGKMHGYLRPILLKYWENKDPDMKIFGRLKKDSYAWHMKNSKYCICAKGYEVNSPRVVEALVNGCVPVILSDNFVPPFFEILDWESFAVFVLEKDIPNLKNILVSISESRYVEMQRRVTQVRQHFLWHSTPLKYDLFHMVLHSIWYNRVMRLSA
ncbi:hypothetical protein ABFS82_05G131700 [Erythranthe guttata]